MLDGTNATRLHRQSARVGASLFVHLSLYFPQYYEWLGACAVGRFSSGRMIRDRGNFVLTTVVPDIGMGNRRSASPRGVIRSPIGSMAVPNRRHRSAIPVTRSPQALASA